MAYKVEPVLSANVGSNDDWRIIGSKCCPNLGPMVTIHTRLEPVSSQLCPSTEATLVIRVINPMLCRYWFPTSALINDVGPVLAKPYSDGYHRYNTGTLSLVAALSFEACASP